LAPCALIPAAFALKRTPLYDLHIELGAKMVPFAGYEMPVHYALGVLKEHLHTRAAAGLFDVSHMGQALLRAGDGRYETVAAAFEALVPADAQGLKSGRQRYTQLTSDDGGILDDLIFTRPADAERGGVLGLVVNASRKELDFEHIAARLAKSVRLEPEPDRALLALQGPKAKDVLARFSPDAIALPFMSACSTKLRSFGCRISRSGYTGEDGFEISIPSGDAVELARMLLAEEGVEPIGLGARDSLRLEAGLCLYGNDIDETTSPIEAGLAWSIQRRRREAGGFPGSARILSELVEGPKRRRVGIRPDGRAPAREGTEVLSAAGEPIGRITSGGFGPTVNGPVAMGYVLSAHSTPGTALGLVVRGKPLPAKVVDLPFVPNRYFKA
jgi:aminomethyltransferase